MNVCIMECRAGLYSCLDDESQHHSSSKYTVHYDTTTLQHDYSTTTTTATATLLTATLLPIHEFSLCLQVESPLLSLDA